MRGNRPSRRSSRSSANAQTKRSESTSESATSPATVQWSFANVTVKIVARKKKLDTRLIGAIMRAIAAGARRAPPRAPRARLAPVTRRRAPARRARPPASGATIAASAAVSAVDVVRRDDDAGARLADQVGRRAVARHRREDRPLGGEVLEHLAREHALAAAARVGDQQQQRLRVALELERAPARDIRDQLEPVAEVERSAHSRSVERKSPTKRATMPGRSRRAPQERPRVALAEEAARVRDPEAVGARVLEAGEVVEVGAVRDRLAPAARRELRASSVIASETPMIASAERAISFATACSPSPSRARAAARRSGAGARRASRGDRPPSGRRSRASRRRRRGGRSSAARS